MTDDAPAGTRAASPRAGPRVAVLVPCFNEEAAIA